MTLSSVDLRSSVPSCVVKDYTRDQHTYIVVVQANETRFVLTVERLHAEAILAALLREQETYHARMLQILELNTALEALCSEREESV
jgi:hypothetical protein